MKVRNSRIVALACAFMILSTATVPSPVGAYGDGLDPDCTDLDEFVWVITVGFVNSDKCDSSTLSERIAQMQEDEAEQEALDIWEGAYSTTMQAQSFGQTFGNYGQDMGAVAWTKVEAETVEQIEAGKTEENVTDAVNATYDDYYSTRQYNLIQNWNTFVVQLDYLRNRSVQEPGVSDQFVRAHDTDNPADFRWSYNGNSTYKTENYTLYNGTTVQLKKLDMYEETGTCTQYQEYDPLNGMVVYNNNGCTDNWPNSVLVESPDANHTRKTILIFEQGGGDYTDTEKEWWYSTYSAIPHESSYSEMDSQYNADRPDIQPFVNGTYDAVQNGTINASDALSSVTMMQEYGLEYLNGSGYWLHAVTAMANMGLDTPNVNKTGTMTISVNQSAWNSSQTFEGFVLARTAPNGTWEVGKQYDTANFSGPVVLVTTDGQKFDLDGTFVIESAVDRDGNSMTNVSTTEYNYHTYNASAFEEKINELLTLQKEIEEREPTSSGGGGSSGGLWDWFTNLGPIEKAGVVAVALVTIIMVAKPAN